MFLSNKVKMLSETSLIIKYGLFSYKNSRIIFSPRWNTFRKHRWVLKRMIVPVFCRTSSRFRFSETDDCRCTVHMMIHPIAADWFTIKCLMIFSRKCILLIFEHGRDGFRWKFIVLREFETLIRCGFAVFFRIMHCKY